MEQYTQSGLIRPIYSNKTNDQVSNEKPESRSMINKEQGKPEPPVEPELPNQEKKQSDQGPASAFDRMMFWCREYWYVIAAALLVLLIVKGK